MYPHNMAVAIASLFSANIETLLWQMKFFFSKYCEKTVNLVLDKQLFEVYQTSGT